MKLREYSGPLTVLIAGILGFSLFCIVSAAALAGPRLPNTSALEPQEIVDSAINNINTMAALTVEAVSQYLPTLTITPSNTHTATSTDVPATGTPTIKPSSTRLPPTRTRDPLNPPPPTSTRAPVPTRTNTPIPTPTYTTVPPSETNTPVPPPTITDTPIPPNTDTPPPSPDTDTPPPSPDTDTPPPTNLPVTT